MKKLIVLAMAVVAMAGCTDAEWAKVGGLGNKFRVTIYSGGKAVRTYTTTGKVLSEDSGSGYYFMDAETKKLVRVMGDLTVEQID